MTIVDEAGHVYLDVTRPDGHHDLIELTDHANDHHEEGT